jgi:hypothetical protein
MGGSRNSLIPLDLPWNLRFGDLSYPYPRVFLAKSV